LGAAIVLGGCGNAAPSKAPPITGKVPDWKSMSKEDKIALIEKQPMPEAEKVKMRQRIEQGLE
jgi:hypothetical protein